jgi:hypothetical protein
MPHKTRLDPIGALQHIIIQGIEHRKIFQDGTEISAKNFIRQKL